MEGLGQSGGGGQVMCVTVSELEARTKEDFLIRISFSSSPALVPLLLTLSTSLISTSVVVIRVLSPSVCFGRSELKRREGDRD